MTLKLKINRARRLAIFAAATTLLALGEDTPATPPPLPRHQGSREQNQRTRSRRGSQKACDKPHQGDVASPTATFGKVAKTDDAYKTAVDAHALDEALKLVDKDGAFKGTVAKVFEPRGLAIVEFDQNYKTALTAIVKGTNFTNFPALTNLVGKEVVVTGKFIKYRDSAEIVLDKPEQVKLVE